MSVNPVGVPVAGASVKPYQAPAGKPHFKIVALSYPNYVYEGDSVTLQAVVKNDGNASGSVELRVYDNGVLVGTATASIDPGNTATLTVTWTPSGTGTHSIRVDAYNTTTGNVDDSITGVLEVKARPSPAPAPKPTIPPIPWWVILVAILLIILLLR